MPIIAPNLSCALVQIEKREEVHLFIKAVRMDLM
jgi:hypothetical protein